MLPVELILLLLDELKAKGHAMVETPAHRDAFEFGRTHGWVQCAHEMEERINSLIETQSEHHSSHSEELRPISSSGNEDEYRF